MAFDEDSPYGVRLRGRERAVGFVHPYRVSGELNQVERWKLDRHPLAVADAVIATYAAGGPGAVDAVAGESERLKWVGLYPQRQGGDAFMLRVKVPGGFLTAAQAREIGVVAEAFGEGPVESAVFVRSYADLTTRQDVQIHWVRLSDVPRIWRRLARVGLTTVQACGDSARNVVSCPVSGVDADEVFDALPVAVAITEFFTGNREYANLPRKFKTSVTGCREDCAQAEIQDVGMWPARAADGRVGFNVLVGGGLGDGERLASDIDVFVEPEEAVELTRAVAHVFAELGNRENRGQSRMRYLVQELGPEGFRAELVARTALRLRPAGEELTRHHRGDHVGVHPERPRASAGSRGPGGAARVYVGCSVPVGRMNGVDLVEAARVAEHYGDGTLRLTTDQNFVLTGVPEDRLDDLLAEPLLGKYSPSPGAFERGVVACTGSEFCRFAVVETKQRAVTWARHLDRVLAGEPVAGAGIVRLHFSGCSASCAQPQIADIGLRGDTAHVGERIVEAVDIGMGGSLGLEAGFIDWVENARPVDEVPEALVRVLRRYGEERRAGETFSNWARRTPNDELRATLAGLVVEERS